MIVKGNQNWAREIGKRISAIREEQDLTQAALADRLGKTPSAISKLESGETGITVGRFFEILKELGYEPSIHLRPRKPETRTDWGAIRPSDPDQRKQIRRARLASEAVADILYDEYGVDSVHAFGSLVDQDGDKFFLSSDIDLAVEGLVPEDLFEANFRLEDRVNEELELTPRRTIQLHSSDQLPSPLDEIPTHFIPPARD